MPLTDANVKAVKPIGKPIKRFDGGGLYLHVTPKGSKLWRLAYRFEGSAAHSLVWHLSYSDAR